MNSNESYQKAFGFFFESRYDRIDLLKEIEAHLSWCFNTREVTKVTIGDKTWEVTPGLILEILRGISIVRQEIADDKARTHYINSQKSFRDRLKAEENIRKNFGNFLEFNRFQPDRLD